VITRLFIKIYKDLLETSKRRKLKSIGAGTRIGDTKIVCPENVSIGDNTSLGGRVYLYAVDNISIGNNCMIGWNVAVTTATHDYAKDPMNHVVKKPVNIGNNVWLGMNVTVLPGVNIAEGVVVGACSVVTKSIDEKNIVVAGNPAKKFKNRFDQR
jgi:acetyltransferase-like isoleucine patch superfamily enzyme